MFHAAVRSRLALSNLLITLVGLFALTFVFTRLLLQSNEDIKRHDLGQQAVTLQKDIVSNGLQNGGRSGLWTYVEHDSRIVNKRIVLFDATNACLVDTEVAAHRRLLPESPNPCDPATSFAWLDRTAAAAHRPSSHFRAEGGQNYLVYQEPIPIRYFVGTVPKVAVGALVLIAPAADVQPALSTLGRVFSIAALAAVVIWLLMGLYFAYTVSRPLVRIREAASAMAEGNYDQRVDIRGGGEIGQLASSFNYMAAQIKASHQLLKDFVANVSHDLRTPLTLISGYAETVLDGTARTHSEVVDSVEVIADEARRMQRLVDDLLQLTRLESGLTRYEPVPFAVDEITDRTLRRVMAKCGRAVVNRVPAGLPRAYGDEELIERVLMNLVDNAITHTPDTGSITVDARVTGRWLEVSVTDTGAGIPAADVDRVFERFYRADRGRSRSDGHSGLGLPIVKEIVEAHGGRVSVESRVGMGTTFRFTLPRADGHKAERPALATSP